MLKAIKEVGSKQLGGTCSVWSALAVAKWCQGMDKEDGKKQRKNIDVLTKKERFYGA
jgi:hypothetical protein